MGQASQSANTSIRRGLRDLTGNATFAQETADYIMLAAEMVTPGTAAKAMKVGGASKVARWAGILEITSASTLSGLDLASCVTYSVDAEAFGLRQAGGSWKRKINRQLFQEHHIISNKNPATSKHPIWSLAGMTPHHLANRMFLPTLEGSKLSTTKRSIHQGRHIDRVHKNLIGMMDKVVRKGEKQGWNQSDYAKQLKEIISKERQALKSGNRALNKHKRTWAEESN